MLKENVPFALIMIGATAVCVFVHWNWLAVVPIGGFILAIAER